MSKGTEHTPAPWKVFMPSDPKYEPISVEAHNVEVSEGHTEDRTICSLPDTDPESLPDARLIAAAPELLEAAERLERAVWDEFGPIADNVHEAAEDLRFAIAKARGEAHD